MNTDKNQPNGSATQPQDVLAMRLALLLDLSEARTGTPVGWNEIATYLDQRGIGISRARWAYMLSGGGPLVTDSRLLLAIADYLEVPVSYLIDLENEAVPEGIAAQLDLVRAMREARVRTFAMRNLGGSVSPELLQNIADYIDKNSNDRRPAE